MSPHRLLSGLAFALLAAAAQAPGSAPSAAPSQRAAFTPVPCENKSWTKADRPVPPAEGTRLFSGEYDGGLYVIEVPDAWNGELMLWAHGHHPSDNANGLVLRVVEPRFRDHLIARGFAWAASSYRCNGYVPGQGLVDTMALRDRFASVTGLRAPSRTYLIGASMGGHAALVGAHVWPDAVDGTLAVCPASPHIMDVFGAVASAAEVITGITASADTLQQDIARMAEILGKPPAYSDKGRQLASVQVHLTGGPRPFAIDGLENQFLGNVAIGLDGLVNTVTPWHRMMTNTDVVYRIDAGLGLQAETLNARVRRKTGDAALRATSSPFREVATFDGRIGHPVLSMHTTGDLLTPVSVQQQLRQAVTAAGRDRFLVQRLYRAAGHCTFSPQEMFTAIDDLTAWVRAGVVPAGDPVLDDLSDAGRRFTSPLRPGDPGTLAIGPTSPSIDGRDSADSIESRRGEAGRKPQMSPAPAR